MAHVHRAYAIFVSVLTLGQAITVPVKKCCPKGEALVKETNECTSFSGSSSFVAMNGVDLTKTIHSPDRVVPINISITGVSKPNCSSHFERHLFRNGKEMTRYGEFCSGTCGQNEGTDYFWCRTEDSWDYCSPDHKHTIYNESCSHNCAKDGSDYYWCPKTLTKEQKETCHSVAHLWDYCSPAKESETWLTVKGESPGKLVTSRYEAEFDHEEFCVDHINSEEAEVVALMCNPCTGQKKGKKHCLNLCCPHGHAQERFGGCNPHNETIDWNPVFWAGSDTEHAQERNKDYILAAPRKAAEFHCPNPDQRALVPAETDIAEFKLQLNGNLKAIYPTDPDCNETATCNVTTSVVHETSEFCLYFGDDPLDYGDDGGYGGYGGYEDYAGQENVTANGGVTSDEDPPSNDTTSSTEVNPNGSFEDYGGNEDVTAGEDDSPIFSYMYCMKVEEKDTSEKVTKSLYPWALGISTFFLFLTLVALILEADLRKGLFGRITVGFVANLFVGYVVLSFITNNDLQFDSRPCVAAAYITQYSFLAFFFWINAMALNIFLKFSMASKFKQNSQNEGRKFWWYFLYAQGLPFVICCITALVDYVGFKGACRLDPLVFEYLPDPEKTKNLPNMGTFTCFLGTGHHGETGTYFEQPSFIYFQLFLIIIQILNITFFCFTVHHLNKHWKDTKDLNRNKEDSNRENLFVVIKLFVIMGVTWIFEFIGGWIEFNHSKEDWYKNDGFAIRLIIDIPNLFQGFLIFVVLVCKEKVIQSLKLKLTGKSARRGTTFSSNSTMKTQKTNAYSESNASPETIPLTDMGQK